MQLICNVSLNELSLHKYNLWIKLTSLKQLILIQKHEKDFGSSEYKTWKELRSVGNCTLCFYRPKTNKTKTKTEAQRSEVTHSIPEGHIAHHGKADVEPRCSVAEFSSLFIIAHHLSPFSKSRLLLYAGWSQ